MRVVFRTRGNNKQGMGDVMGCLALAEVFQSHKSEILFIVDNDHEAIQCISQHGYKVKPVSTEEKEFSYVESFKPEVIVVNQLNNPEVFLRELKRRTNLLVTIDDAGPGAGVADIRFNPLYSIDAPDSYCSAEFVPLREEFQDINKKERIINKEVKDVLVTLGGSDTYGFTPRVVHALSRVPDAVSIAVILGPAFRHIIQLNEAIHDAKRPFSVLKEVSNMPELIFASDLVICGGGITLFESACTGTPVVVICGEPFEEETAMRMEEKGVCINLGFGDRVDENSIYEAVNRLMEDYHKRLEMSQQGKKLVDGQGARRIAETILQKSTKL